MSTLRALVLATLIILINGDKFLALNSESLSDLSGDSCKEDLDCGSNIKYEICDNDKCRYCKTNSECNINNQNDNCSDNHWCEMKSLWKSFDSATIGTIIAIFVGAFIAAGGGLGGGGIFVPVFILLLDFDAKSAAALSQATIFGGSIVNLIMNFRESHPNKNRSHRPLTDFNTILILEPMLLGGTVIGVLLNEILPDPIILVCLILVLTIALYRMILKVISQWKKENELRMKNNLVSGDSLIQNSNRIAAIDHNALLRSSVSAGTSVVGANNANSYDENQSVNSAKKLMNNYQPTPSDMNISEIGFDIEDLAIKCGQTPYELCKNLSGNDLNILDSLIHKETRVMKPLLWMLAVWIIVSIFALLRSGDFILKVDKCSTLYWILEFGVFPCLFVITFFIAKMNMNDFNRKMALKWIPAEGDIQWNINKSIIYPSIAALAGLLGGLLGIGGGMIVSPLLLELGVLPRVASATSAVAVLMTSSSSTFQKVLLNMIRYDYMVFFACVGIIGTFIGQTVVNFAIRKYGRNSIVIAAVASVIGVAIVLMGLNSILNMKWNFEFDSVC